MNALRRAALASLLALVSCSSAAQVLITPPADEWGVWKSISEERSGGIVRRWFSKDGLPKAEAKDLLFISQGPGSTGDLVGGQQAAAFLLNVNCKGGRIDAPEPRIEGNSGIAYMLTHCDADSEFRSGVVAYRKILVNQGSKATVVRLWKVPLGQARSTESANPEEVRRVLTERNSVLRYMSQISLCMSESDATSCVK